MADVSAWSQRLRGEDMKRVTANKFETRQLPCGDLQTREAEGITRIFGYASVFDQVAYQEVIRPGAFTKTLQEQKDIHCYWNHDSSAPLGRQSNGTLTLRQDDKGLYMEVVPNLDTTWGRDALAAVCRGDVKGMSFGFRITDGGWITENDEDIYEIKGVALREVSPCTDPWYDETEAHTRENINESTPSSDGEEIEQGQSEDETTLEAVPNADTLKAGPTFQRLLAEQEKMES